VRALSRGRVERGSVVEPRRSAGRVALAGLVLLGCLVATAPAAGQRAGGDRGQPADTTGAGGAPDLGALVSATAQDSDLRVAVRRFELDRAALGRRYDVPLSPVRIERERAFLNGWLQRLDALDPASLNEAGRADHVALRQQIATGLVDLEAQERRAAAIAPLLPAALRPLQQLQESRRDRLDVDPRAAAQTLEDARKQVVYLTAVLTNNRRAGFPGVTPETAAATLEYVDALVDVLDNWYGYYYGFDPLFTWWVQTPYREFAEALDPYRTGIRRAWGLEE
jgi:hypothetical protein